MHPSEFSAESGAPDPHVQHIDCSNDAAFVLRFVVQRLDGGRAISQSHRVGPFHSGQTRRVDLSALRFHGQPLEVGDRVRLRVGAVGGVRRNGPDVAYAPNGETAVFSVRGTTLAFSIGQA
ncbi:MULTISPECIES: hypothetical protein [Lysobacter]|uniref:Uncharacterized protein n=1 Tax=Lysobacter yananisis TaxID=1003114 RepID=A0ABY9P9K0_9GAMM|nr:MULTISPECIES: hypothetical protein [Lysobacter]QQQ00467.1 hypothetical protein JHW41_20645 [Lysobacter enzymogenes]UZW59915.1 hypothetical protein BV903_021980 [Lysobacter enzymogenes]WMT03753.1 hypothetical protein RDV84_02590 [Lysobacter yananisis]